MSRRQVIANYTRLILKVAGQIYFKVICFFLSVMVLGSALAASAQDDAKPDFPFRDTKLSDDARIADLLSRLSLDEKINLMSDHPRFPRLNLVFSGQVEGLHGLALGGPGGWGGSRGRQRP